MDINCFCVDVPIALGLIVQTANLMPDKSAEPNQDRSAVTKVPLAVILGSLQSYHLAERQGTIILSTLIQNCTFKAAAASPVLEKREHASNKYPRSWISQN